MYIVTWYIKTKRKFWGANHRFQRYENKTSAVSHYKALMADAAHKDSPVISAHISKSIVI